MISPSSERVQLAAAPNQPFALAGLRVLVPIQKRELALGIISGVNLGRYEAILLKEHPLSRLECPKCKSEDTAPHIWLWKLALVSE